MIAVHVDPAGNRLDLVIRSLALGELAELPDRVRTAARALRIGFIAGVDLRGMSALPRAETDGIRTAQEAILACGASRIGTLLDSPALESQLACAARTSGSDGCTRRFGDEAAWRGWLATGD